ncbi:MAG TPA: PEPxxWA-CTERM sorting domain-containing protein [Caulobacteraceae bacterium]|jgi:hypothetical protein|nr:PEPxxWA-CTERM sorting domain-containing protein [Caulobacteraceae bacterium]
MIRKVLICGASALALSYACAHAQTQSYSSVGLYTDIKLAPGTYEVVLAGAAGSRASFAGILGEVVTGQITLTHATYFDLLVGGQGSYDGVYGVRGGGGGGTFLTFQHVAAITYGNYAAYAVMIAGGGGGGGAGTVPGLYFWRGGYGGGLFTYNGGEVIWPHGDPDGASFANGGQGGSGVYGGAPGGFGGGGGMSKTAGGGGGFYGGHPGYKDGNGVLYGIDQDGHSGSPFINSRDVSNGAITYMANPSHGYADFTLISSGTPEPSSWALMLGGVALLGAALRRRHRAAAARTGLGLLGYVIGRRIVG